jgi:hypothetical protein
MTSDPCFNPGPNLITYPMVFPQDHTTSWASVVLGWMYPSAPAAKNDPVRTLMRDLALTYSE